MNKRKNPLISFNTILYSIFILSICVILMYVSTYEPSWCFNWKEIRKEVKDSIKIYETSSITTGVGGYGYSTQDEVKRRKWIMNYATESELKKLITYPNGNVKAIAYEGFLRKNDIEIDKTKLVLEAIKDTTYTVHFQSGCIGTGYEIGEYLMKRVLSIDSLEPPIRPELRIDYNFSKTEITEILKEYNKRPRRE